MSNWITYREFADKYDTSIENITGYSFRGSIPTHVTKKLPNGRLVIDEDFFIRRNEFKTNLVESNIQKLYQLLEGTNENRLAIELAEDMKSTYRSLVVWFNGDFFKLDNTSILHYKVTSLHWKFYRLKRRLLDE